MRPPLPVLTNAFLHRQLILKKMSLRLSQRLVISLLLVLAYVLPAWAQQPAEPPLITVTGQAEIKVAPDEVVFNIEIEKTDKDLGVAKNLNDESVRKVLALARRYNVEQQDVQTDYISVEPKYSDDEAGVDGGRRSPRVFIGYAVSKTVVIRFRDLARFESLFSDILKIDITRIRNVDFRTTELRKHKDQARAMAIKAAQEKAIALTREIGQTIGKAYSIREEGPERGYAQANAGFIAGGVFSASETTFAPGLISVQAQVTVSFRLQ